MTSTNININENFQRADLPSSIIWPPNEEDIPWFMQRLYDLMASAINSKDFNYYQLAIGTTPTPLLNINNFGSYIVCVSGTDKIIDENGVISWPPTKVSALCKTRDTVAGTIFDISSQPGAGVAPWLGSNLNFGSTTLTNGQVIYNISHTATGKTASFNVRIIGTQ